MSQDSTRNGRCCNSLARIVTTTIPHQPPAPVGLAERRVQISLFQTANAFSFKGLKERANWHGGCYFKPSHRTDPVDGCLAVLPGGAVEPNARPRCTVDLSCQSPGYGDNINAHHGPEPFFHGQRTRPAHRSRPGPFFVSAQPSLNTPASRDSKRTFPRSITSRRNQSL